MTKLADLPLEDELGDVLEKAMRRAGISKEELAVSARVPLGKILDAIDYRPDLTDDELRRVAVVLRLNDVGVCAIGSGRYPRPEIGVLPFCVWPLRMPHGIGVANAYLVGACDSCRAILFDTGAGFEALKSVWPPRIRQLDAVFLTHAEGEHAGGLEEIVAHFDVRTVFIPIGANAALGRGLGDGEVLTFGPVEVSAFKTPGHSAAHNCYYVRAPIARTGAGLLVSGDLVFAGSVGGAYFSHELLHASLRRVLDAVPPATVIAPGHGPMTTVENELRFNPFAS